MRLSIFQTVSSGRNLGRMTTTANGPGLCSMLLVVVASLSVTCFAQSPGQEQPTRGTTLTPAMEPGPVAAHSAGSIPAASAGISRKNADEFTESRLGLSLLKNITLDQKAIWTSPTRWRSDDANWLLPFAGIAAASLASDTHISKALTRSNTLVNQSNTFSNYGL